MLKNLIPFRKPEIPSKKSNDNITVMKDPIVVPNEPIPDIIANHFDSEYYMKAYPSDIAKDTTPLDHYSTVGWRQGRNPTAWFDVAYYLERNPDVAKADLDPFHHYLNHGKAEGRAPSQSQEGAVVPAVLKEPQRKAPIGAPSAETQGVAPSHEVAPRIFVPPFFSIARQKYLKSCNVFTSVIGKRHLLENNTTFFPDRTVYSDRSLSIPGWNFRPSLMWDPNPKINVLFHKYVLASLCEEGCRFIWIDSRVSVQSFVLERMFQMLETADLCVFRHYERDCVYDEVEAVRLARRATDRECDDYLNYLNRRGYPRSGGLYETGVFGFRTGPAVACALSQTFGLAFRHIARDQLTLPIVLSESNLDISVFAEGTTNLRNTPGIFVHKWPDEEA